MIDEPFRRDQLADVGLTPRRLSTLVARGEVVRLFRGVYAPATWTRDLAGRARALRLLLPDGAAACRTTAAWLHGVDARPPGRHTSAPPLECVVRAGDTPPRHRGVRAYAARLPAADVIELHGVPVTSLERTAIDCARYLPPFLGLSTLDVMAREQRLETSPLLERLEDWRGERFVAQARRLLGLCDARAESPGESWTRLRLADAGFPTPELQIWVPHEGAGAWRLDMGWDEPHRVSVEYDGQQHHEGREAHDEHRRFELLRAHGWHVVPVTRGDVLGRGMHFERAVGELLGQAPTISRRLW